jgi:pilus assembly protein CpaB
MWKVKRMNRARIVVLTIAVGAGGVAACIAGGLDSKPPPVEPVAQLQTWPAAATSNTFIRPNERPDATTQIAGLIASSPNIVRYGVSNPTTMQK